MNSHALIRKARRAAKSIVGGEEILQALLSPRYMQQLFKAVSDEVPPVSFISDMLVEDIAEADLKAMPVRQFIGTTVKAILVSEGYEVVETGVRIPQDAVFRTGATYRKVSSPEEDDDDLLTRFVSMLNVDELERLHGLVKAAL